MVKIVKLKVVKPINIDWDVFGQIVRDADYTIYRLKNRTITEYHYYMKRQYDIINEYERKHGEKMPKDLIKRIPKDYYGGKSYADLIKKEIRPQFEDSGVYLSTLTESIKEAIGTYQKNVSAIFKGLALPPTFKRHQPMYMPGQKIQLRNVTFYKKMKTQEMIEKEIKKGTRLNNDEISIPLASKIGKKKYGLKKGQVILKVASRKGYAKIAMKRLNEGRYTVCDSHLCTDGKSVYIQLAFKDNEVKQVAVDKDKILGLDLGIAKAVTMQVADTKKHDFIEGGEITAFRNRVNARRRSIQNQLKYCSDNRRGHGRKTLLRPLEKLEHKIENFKETTNHRYSRYIVDYAIKNGCGTIQMEKLSGIASDNSFLKTWSYYDLQTKIEYKAKDVGIDVKYIEPQYTSQRCNCCGVIDKASRVTQDQFKCTTCGHTTNADLNASRNIAMKDIETIIQNQIEAQKDNVNSNEH